MKLKLITSSFVLSLLMAIAPNCQTKIQAQGLVPNDVLQYRDFLTPQNTFEVPSSPTNLSWRNLSLLYSLENHQAPVVSLAFNPQGNILVSAGSTNDPLMRFWAMTTGKQIDFQRAHATRVMAVAYSPDGTSIVSAGQGAGINLWDGNNRENRATFLLHANNIMDIAISPDSSTLVSGALDGIRVWNLRYARPNFTLIGVGNPSYALGMHPNGYLIASGNREGKVSFWNLRTAELISEFSPHKAEIQRLIFTPDGRRIITSSTEKTIKIWDLTTGELVQEFTGHQDDIHTIALSPDGKILASGGKDGVRIWEVATGELITVIPDNQDWVESLAFSPDSTMLAIGSYSTKIQVWKATTSEPVAVNEQ